MAETQSNRILKVHTPLGEDVLLIRSMQGGEELGRLSKFSLDLVSRDHNLDTDKLLGNTMTVEIEQQGGGSRFFHGYVERIDFLGIEEEYSSYQVSLRPWLWFLTKSYDCRIYQNMTVPDILKSVFRHYGHSEFEDSLTQSYAVREYCVQYRESAFDFVSRLMEKEGIYYYFTHDKSSHKLVLCDGINGHQPVTDYESVPFFPPEHDLRREREHVFAWRSTAAVESGKYATTDYDYNKPRATLLSERAVPSGPVGADFEVFDYPGAYLEGEQGDHYAAMRLEELTAHQRLFQGSANARGLHVGGLFKLEQYPRGDQNREYLITAASYRLTSNSMIAGQQAQGAPEFLCDFSGIASDQPFRARSLTPLPVMQGPQTATVVGHSSDEISTDELGRVKLQFHWDRYGKADEQSSCWVRVSQAWAGAGWGSMHVPRIGQEVIVDFLEGNPDRPIVTGRVYNGDNAAPFELPANATQSGIKSRSSQGGNSDNFNAIRMEDKKGEEELYLHAEKDKTLIVKNNQSSQIGNNRSDTVGNDETRNVGNKRSVSVGADHEETVGGAQTVTIGSDQSVTVAAAFSHAVGSTYDIQAASDYTCLSTTSITLTVGGSSMVMKPDSIMLMFGSSSIRIDATGVALMGPKISLNG